MCSRYYRSFGEQAIVEELRAEATGNPLAYTPVYNIAPTTTQPVLRQNRDTLRRELVPMHWGLVGYESENIEPRLSNFNARAEDLERNSRWGRLVYRQRCIIPMSGYYEWRKTDKQPFRFTFRRNDRAFGTAGLWDVRVGWAALDGGWFQSFTVITVESNHIAERVHDRMPAILAPSDFDEWLDQREVDRLPLHLLRPCDDRELFMHPAHPKVGSILNQGPELLMLNI